LDLKKKHIPDCPTLFLTFLPVISKSGTIGKTPSNRIFSRSELYVRQTSGKPLLFTPL